ncbi:MAG: HAMP domain-containing histidine kinase [Pirellulaceae bacterium]|nr:HAMP domain-containing histidine kinase [Pirellulaceae bacterium]
MRRAHYFYLWLAFGSCLAVVLAAMAWVSETALELHQAQAAARNDAALEANVRLALWRIDSVLTPLVTQENMLPPSNYGLAPNALREDLDPNGFVLVRFQLESDGRVTTLPRRESGLASPKGPKPELLPPLDYAALLPKLPDVASLPWTINPAGADAASASPDPAAAVSSPPQLIERDRNEFQARNRAVMSNTQQTRLNFNQTSQFAESPPPAESSAGVMRPMWMGERLILARRAILRGYDILDRNVVASESECIQGTVLDWPGLRKFLQTEIADLLPEASLRPADAGVRESRLLAALPIAIEPGRFTASDAPSGPLDLVPTLCLAWAGVLIAALAVAILLWGVMRLGERRATFVSAVTHELRSPLTTLRMYAEMLCEGMVADPEKQRHYFQTLRAETDRLGHLVENVLAYARLERNRAGQQSQDLSIGELLDNVTPRLATRAAQAEMNFVVGADESIRVVTVRANPSAVDQILFNLVDNSCKYAARAHDRRIQLDVVPSDRHVLLRLADHGPGLDATTRRSLFRPFVKSAADAAVSAPGVGIGLALSRRLARQMGGDLRHVVAEAGGTVFELRLPSGSQ